VNPTFLASRGEHAGGGVSRGPVWGAASEDLNATKLVWPAGQGPAEHEADRDVAYVILEGSVALMMQDGVHELGVGDVVIVPKGERRSLTAGGEGVQYVTVHVRRGGLQIRPAPPAS
jgi:mannose-6-phosphate isomerase-like protein (cupin superfamily)